MRLRKELGLRLLSLLLANLYKKQTSIISNEGLQIMLLYFRFLKLKLK